MAAARKRYWRLTFASIAACWRPYWRQRRVKEAPSWLTRFPGIVQDFVHGVRTTRRRPGFALSVAATLAVGIAATTVVFGFVNALALRPLPYADAAGLAFLLGWDTRADEMRFQLRYDPATALRE